MGIRRWLGLADRPRPNRANAGADAPAVDGYRGVDEAEGAYNDFSMTARLPDDVDADASARSRAGTHRGLPGARLDRAPHDAARTAGLLPPAGARAPAALRR